MLNVGLKKLLMILYFVVGSLVLEAVTFNILGFGGMPEYFFYDLAIIFILAFVVFIIPNFTAQYIIYTIILLAQTVFAYIDYSLYTIYGDLVSIDMLWLLDEAGAAVNSSFIYFTVILQLVAVFILIAVAGFWLLKSVKKERINRRHHFSVVVVSMLLAVQCLSVGVVFFDRNSINALSSISDENYLDSDAFYLNTNLMKSSSYVKFGTYGYFLNLIYNYCSKSTDYEKTATISYFNSGSTYDSSSSEVFGIDEGNNVIVIMMESLEWFGFGDGNYDSTLENLSSELTPNIYALIYGDDSYDESADTDKTSTTKDDQSLIASSFFAKSKTNISEGMGIMGNYPTSNTLANLIGNGEGKEDMFGYSLPSILQDMGYTTTYVHSNYISFYDRDETHPYLGFDNVIGKDSVTNDQGEYIYTGDDLLWGHWDCEGSFAQNAIDYIIPYDTESTENSPFYTFYLTVSTHGSYEYSETEGDCLKYMYYVMYGEDDCYYDSANNVWKLKNKSQEDLTYTTWYSNVLANYGSTDPDLCEELLYYECGVMGLDEAIGVIIDTLVDYGIYDETTIVLYSDHYSYYSNMSNRVKGFDTYDVSSIELNTIPFIISSPGLKTSANASTYTITDRFCSAYDVVPTLMDLLGIEYNTNLYVGRSLFTACDYVYKLDDASDTTYDMVVYYSNTGGLFSRDVYSYDLETFVYTDDTLSDEKKEEIKTLFVAEAKKVLTKLNYLSILNTSNLYSSLG